MTRPTSSDPHATSRDLVAKEMSAAKTLGLIEDPAMAKGVETNLELLASHYAIVVAALDALEGASN
ncbi:MAG: hypothetical protein AAF642_05705 [Pseudomonadota bacterium]